MCFSLKTTQTHNMTRHAMGIAGLTEGRSTAPPVLLPAACVQMACG